jgi:hypothetical protein
LTNPATDGLLTAELTASRTASVLGSTIILVPRWTVTARHWPIIYISADSQLF